MFCSALHLGHRTERIPVGAGGGSAGNTATMMRPTTGSRPVMKAQPNALRFFDCATAPATTRLKSQPASPSPNTFVASLPYRPVLLPGRRVGSVTRPGGGLREIRSTTGWPTGCRGHFRAHSGKRAEQLRISQVTSGFARFFSQPSEAGLGSAP
jgi:hypothetical protein